MQNLPHPPKCRYIVQTGFTLIEILLVVALISLLAGIVIFAVNPSKQLAESRNAQRKLDISSILNAVHQYALDNNGSFPPSINQNSDCLSAGNDICSTSGEDCGGRIDLSALTTNAKYLIQIPLDPVTGDNTTSNYYIIRDMNNHIVVCAPDAELETTISLTR